MVKSKKKLKKYRRQKNKTCIEAPQSKKIYLGIIILMSILVIILVSATTWEDVTKLEYYETGSDDSITGDGLTCQTFTIGNVGPSGTYESFGASLSVVCSACSGSAVLKSINSSGYPDTQLASNISIPGLPANDWVNITFLPGSTLISGTTYAICTNGSMELNTDESSPTYSGGNYIEMNSTGIFNVSTRDVLFMIWGNESATPNIIINTPSNNSKFIRKNDITFNCSSNITSGVGLKNITLIIDSINNLTITNTTANQRNLSLQTTLNSDSFTAGEHTYKCNSYSINSDLGETDTNIFTIGDFAENSQTFNTTTVETSTENFIINLTYDSTHWSSISANLVYNETSYLGTKSGSGNTISFSRSINVPIVKTNTNITFKWELSLTNSTGTFNFNSTFNNQSISPVIFTRCNSTYDVVFANYTLINESNRAIINGNMNALFSYRIPGSDSPKNYSLNETNSSWAFCSSVNTTMLVDVTMEITKNEFTSRNFFFNDESYSKIQTNRNLTLLSSDKGRDIIIDVKDAGLQPLENYVVELNRLYPQSNEYVNIISDKTDEFGGIVARLIENTVKYRFVFKNPSGVIVKSTDDITIACRTSICVLPFIIEDTEDDFDRFENISDFTSSLSFDNDTNIVTASWSDLTGESITMRLLVESIGINGSGVICNQTSTSLSSSLNCNVGSNPQSYSAQLFRKVSGESERRISVLNFKIGEKFKTFGKEGLIWSFLLIFTLISAFMFNPQASAVMYLVGYIFLGILGIISFNLPLLFANTVIVIAFIWAFKG